MSIRVTFNYAHRVMLASEFFMARRPILNRQNQLAAHELLFCGTADEVDMRSMADDRPITASVIADVYRHGVGRVLGDMHGFLHVGAEALMSDIFQFLPPQQIVLAISEAIPDTPQIMARIAELSKAGFVFTLDVAVGLEHIYKLLPLVEFVRIDITDKKDSDLNTLCELFKSHQKKLVAENVESIEQFRFCADAGFDYFQGYYFAKPQILEGKSLSPSQLAITELMSLIASDADTAVIENSIKGDVSLGLNLLRLVNTPAVSAHRIHSLRQALMALGRNQLQRWLQIMLYAEPGQNGRSMMPLLAMAATRGRLLELVAQKTRPGNRSIADTAFTVGIMSLMDTLFSMPMEKILKQIAVVEEVGDALLYRKGYFGELLNLAECTEWADKTETPLLQMTPRHRLSCTELYMLQLATFEWCDRVTNSMR